MNNGLQKLNSVFVAKLDFFKWENSPNCSKLMKLNEGPLSHLSKTKIH